MKEKSLNTDPAIEYPSTGGSYLRDPLTGALTPSEGPTGDPDPSVKSNEIHATDVMVSQTSYPPIQSGSSITDSTSADHETSYPEAT